MTFLSSDQLTDVMPKSPALSQRGRAGMQLLGSIQNYSAGVVRPIAKADFEGRESHTTKAVSGTAGYIAPERFVVDACLVDIERDRTVFDLFDRVPGPHVRGLGGHLLERLRL